MCTTTINLDHVDIMTFAFAQISDGFSIETIAHQLRRIQDYLFAMHPHTTHTSADIFGKECTRSTQAAINAQRDARTIQSTHTATDMHKIKDFI